jgi:hypothetical protein
MNVYRVGQITKDLSHNYNLRFRATKTDKTVDKNITTEPKLLVNKAKEKIKNVGNIPHEFIDYNIVNLFPDLINMADQAANTPAPVQLVREFRGLAPPKFEGHMNENAAWWLQKFEAFVANQAIQGDDRLRVLYYSFRDPAKTGICSSLKIKEIPMSICVRHSWRGTRVNLIIEQRKNYSIRNSNYRTNQLKRISIVC